MTTLNGATLLEAPDYPAGGWYPAHANNFSVAGAGYYNRPNHPSALILHTPEEDADDRELTPVYFHNPIAGVSTHYYGDSDGDVIQMVQDIDCAYAQGTRTQFAIIPRPVWHQEGVSYNCTALSYEIEGRAKSVHQTMKIGGAQWNSLVEWIRYKTAKYSIPRDRLHILGHNEINNQKHDPGDKFPWLQLMEAININPRPPQLTMTNPRWPEYGMAIFNYDGRQVTPLRRDDRYDYYEVRYRKATP